MIKLLGQKAITGQPFDKMQSHVTILLSPRTQTAQISISWISLLSETYDHNLQFFNQYDSKWAMEPINSAGTCWQSQKAVFSDFYSTGSVFATTGGAPWWLLKNNAGSVLTSLFRPGSYIHVLYSLWVLKKKKKKYSLPWAIKLMMKTATWQWASLSYWLNYVSGSPPFLCSQYGDDLKYT